MFLAFMQALHPYIGLVGIAALIGTLYLWSDDRRNIPWKMVFTILALTTVLGILFLKAPGFTAALGYIGYGCDKLGDFAMQGMVFVLGETIAYGKFLPSNMQGEFIFGIRLFGMIVFICGLCDVLYHIRVLPWVVKMLSFGLRVLGLGGAESLSVAGTPFLGQVEAQLLIKNFLSKLTPSALLTCMTTSMAATAGSALLLYMSLGLKPQFLIIASILNCLHGVLASKMKRPETNFDQLAQGDVHPAPSTASNIFDAAENGAMHGARIAIGVIVMVAFFIGVMAMLNAIFDGVLSAAHISMTFQQLLGVPFAPVAFLFGIPWERCMDVGRLIATGGLFNEVIAMVDYMKLVNLGELPDRLQLIITCAITLFAHPGSIGIQIGGLRKMAPERGAEISSNAPRAMLLATMAAWMTACICSLIV